ncbi:MAG: hypothetical protein HYT85_12300 [candidate division NC10 bacterium]|nr:hypothetical protein [candidate division NC10 bacterium]MBI2456917.1 hypothetical protein [candidate division NC10 bacterium]
MAELRKAVGVKVELVEELVKQHFGPEFTSKIAWSFARGKYIPSTLPRRVATPQKLLGLRIGWKTVGEFSDNIGFRLELWDPTYLRQAEALVEEYNKKTDGTKLELYPFYLHWPAAARRSAA